MLVRAKKSGPYQYLQVVENRREGAKLIRRVISTLGRLHLLNAKDHIGSLVRSLSRFSEQALLVLSGKSNLLAEARKIDPALVVERLWEGLAMGRILKDPHFLPAVFIVFKEHLSATSRQVVRNPGCSQHMEVECLISA